MAKQRQEPRASRIRVRVQPRRPIDLQRLARAVIEIAMRDVEEQRSAEESDQKSKADEGIVT
jgi:hypothetical protein